jgi:hypothetical protein
MLIRKERKIKLWGLTPTNYLKKNIPVLVKQTVTNEA